MPLNIVVCIKRTPATTTVTVDPATSKVRNEGLSYGMSPFDEYALEEGIRIKERAAGSWTAALSLGTPESAEVLREAIARGCDGGYLLSHQDFTDSDTYATSYALAQAIKKIAAEKGKVDLVICSKQTNDSDTGQVGPSLAAWLDWPAVAFVKKVETISETSIRVHRMMEDGADILDMPLPAVITVVKEINEPRLPSLKGKMASKKAAIPTWGPAEIGADSAKIGGQGSLTTVLAQRNVPTRSGGARIEGATLEEKAQKLVTALKEMKLL